MVLVVLVVLVVCVWGGGQGGKAMQHGLQRNRDGSHAPPSHLPPTICAFGVAACSSKPRALSKCGCACSVPASSAAFGCAIKASTLPPAAWATCEGVWH